jgi:hypothetical protein
VMASIGAAMVIAPGDTAPRALRAMIAINRARLYAAMRRCNAGPH